MPARSSRRRSGCRRRRCRSADGRSLNGTGDLYFAGPRGYRPPPFIPRREEADMKTGDRDDLPCFRGHFQAA